MGTAVLRSFSRRLDEVVVAGTGEDVGRRWKRAEEGCVGGEAPAQRLRY